MTGSTRRLEARTIKAADCPVAAADKQFLAVERLFGAVVLRLESRILLRTSR
jgi:fructose-specific phosphotransferase system component IIB